MADYADLDRVMNILGTTTEPDAETFAALNAVASRELEQACGVAAFGDETADETDTLYPAGAYDVLLLDRPIRSVTSLTIDDTPFTAYRPLWRTATGAYLALITTDGSYWAGTVAVTGQWGDMPNGAIPPDVTEAASVLVAGYVRKDKTGDGDVSGPEGLTFRPGNAWNDERVKRVITAYKARAVLVL